MIRIALGSALLVGLNALAAPPLSSASRLKIISGDALRETFKDFAKSNLDVIYAPPGEIKQRILRGEVFDLAITSEQAMEELAKSGKIASDSKANFAQVGTGVAVRAGAARPDISSVEAFKHTLLKAKSIAFSEPSTGAVSGVHFQKIIETLGITQAVRSKAVINSRPATVRNAEIVARGQAELGIQLTNEIVPVHGAELLGPIPASLQSMTVISVGILTSSRNQSSARDFIRFLSSSNAAKIIRDEGMEPLAANE